MTRMHRAAAIAAGMALAFAGAGFGAPMDGGHHAGRLGGGGMVTRAEFEHLQGQVQALEGRVAALERMSGKGGGRSHRGTTSHDAWSGH